MTHSVFHMSMLRKYLPDPSHVLSSLAIRLDENLSYEEKLVAVADRLVKKLCSKEVLLIKVIRKNHSVEEVTRETEDSMHASYPHLFLSQGNTFLKFGDQISKRG